MDTKVSIISTKDDKKVTTTLSNVNPKAADSELYQMAVGFNELTTNTLTSAKRIDTKEISTGSKITPTITLSRQPDGSTTDNFATVSENLAVWEYIVTDSDAIPYISKNTAYCTADIIRETGDDYDIFALNSSTKDPQSIWDDSAEHSDINGNAKSKTGYVNIGNITDATARIVVTLPETDTYDTATATLYIKYA